MSTFAKTSPICQLLLLASVATASANSDGMFVPRASSSLMRIKKNDRIINGYEAEEDRYPYSVNLNSYGEHFCGGSLIANDVVLTAAHCMEGDLSGVRIGSDDVDEGEPISKRKEVIHPRYNPDSNKYDMALVFLQRSPRMNFPLVRVNDDSLFPSVGSTVVTMGWGDMDAGSKTNTPDDLHAVDLEVISNSECDKAESGSSDYKGDIYDSMLCTFTKGKDACQGDSGGPLVVTGNKPEDDVLVGIVSWGVGCAFLPGVFSRVSEAYDWIVETVCDESDDPPESLCGTPEPTPEPTLMPTEFPTLNPTEFPTLNPTWFPTLNPTRNPTRRPTRNPTRSPTRRPTQQPTKNPTRRPTDQPTSSPTTSMPTSSPTERPTDSPSVSSAPTGRPSASPTLTSAPTAGPSGAPSTSAAPSAVPSDPPTASSRPSGRPSSGPSLQSSGQPSWRPSGGPSSRPSGGPSTRPSSRPSLSFRPSSRPSAEPSHRPSIGPSPSPSTSIRPSMRPSSAPSFVPSNSPTATTRPSGGPTPGAPPAVVGPGADRSAISGNSMLVSEASASDASAPIVGEKAETPPGGRAETPSGGVGRGVAVGAWLFCVISTCMAL